MKIKTKTILKDNQGKPLPDGDKDMLLGGLLGFALSHVKNGNDMRSYQLAQKIVEAKTEVELSTEEVVFVKEVLQKCDFMTPIYTGQAMSILEGTEGGV